MSPFQLLKKWAPVFKNYVKRAQDHLDCLSAFEEHFLDQESHWPAMVKVSGHTHTHCPGTELTSVVELWVCPSRS